METVGENIHIHALHLERFSSWAGGHQVNHAAGYLAVLLAAHWLAEPLRERLEGGTFEPWERAPATV